MNRYFQYVCTMLHKNKEIILYLFFGGCTTIINTVCYAIMYDYINVSNVYSTIIAWIVSVIFAFITNKFFVFQSRNKSLAGLINEVISFFSCRLATGILDVAIMIVAVDCFYGNSLFWKLLSNIIVIVINYVASKLMIFKK